MGYRKKQKLQFFFYINFNKYLAYPDYDGGSPVIDFEVQVTNPDNSSRIVYRGCDLDCTVAGLLPGRPYLFQVRAFNRAGVCICFLLSIDCKEKNVNLKFFFV